MSQIGRNTFARIPVMCETGGRGWNPPLRTRCQDRFFAACLWPRPCGHQL